MTDDDDGNPFTRKIETSSKINEKTIQPMKIPNTLDGLSAASIDYSISNVVTVLSKSTQFVFFATLWKGKNKIFSSLKQITLRTFG